MKTPLSKMCLNETIVYLRSVNPQDPSALGVI